MAMLSCVIMHVATIVGPNWSGYVCDRRKPIKHLNDCWMGWKFLNDKYHKETGVLYTAQKATIHQVTTMQATSKNILFPGHNHLLTTSAHHPDTLIIAQVPAYEGSSIPVVSRWLWPGSRTFLEVASMVVTWWIVAFSSSVIVWSWLATTGCESICLTQMDLNFF